MTWESLTSIDDLDKAIAKSYDQTVILFKHSTTCSISAMALARVENAYASEDYDYSFYLLDLLRYRAISNEIASRFHIQHESPQLLVLDRGNCIYNASHLDIDLKDIPAVLSQNV